jgi:hypothetical protein
MSVIIFCDSGAIARPLVGTSLGLQPARVIATATAADANSARTNGRFKREYSPKGRALVEISLAIRCGIRKANQSPPVRL